MTKVRHKFICIAVNLLCVVVLSEGMELEKSDDERVVFEKDGEITKITIDENISDAELFSITNADGIPSLNSKIECSGFKYEIKNVNGVYVFDLTNPLNYEDENCKEMSIDIVDEGNVAYSVLYVNNLDDNAPQLIIPDDSECLFQENTEYTVENTTCFIRMTDEDGMMENAEISITDETYDKLFSVSYLETPAHDDKSVDVQIYLKDGITLDYEDVNKYIFTVQVQEEVTASSIQVALDVEDMNDQPPKWTSLFTTQQFEENEDQTFSVKAIDGDIGINSPIYYEIHSNGCDGYYCDITIDESTGSISVTNVDREDVGSTITFEIWAIETDDNSYISQSIYFFIEDQNDNSPIITYIESDNKSVNENYVGQITTFNVEDMDLATYGTYDVKMECDDNSVDYTVAFQVIPVTGYQQQQFTLTVVNSGKLDFEDEDWKDIKFDLVAIEQADSSHHNRKTINIHLIDLNDEAPIFVNDTEEVNILESITKGEFIFDAEATDRDANDVVSYVIVGTWGQKLVIDENGVITPAADEIFDYEQLQQVVIQIKATDNDEVHTTYKTLTINVIDIDDEPPTIKVGSKRVSLYEDEGAGYDLLADITASDVDTVPKLSLEIDWSSSSITKNSADVPDFDNWKCFDLTTEAHKENAQKIIGILKVSESCSPDFEIFDTIFIGLKVIDENTEIGDNYGIGSIQVFILDSNDNAPIFDSSSFEGLQVTDGTNTTEKIGSVIASDADISDSVTYSIEPLDADYDWVDINSNTGLLTIKSGVTINDDIPPKQDISFNIIASDGLPEHDTTKQLDIAMIDYNNKKPNITNKVDEIEILEKTTEGIVLVLEAEDKDRDDPYNKMVFTFDTYITERASNSFEISEDGTISVSLRNGATLDRDSDSEPYLLPILVYDNPKGTVQLHDNLELTVILQDINDHAPVISTETLECYENMAKGGTLGPIVAEDLDEEGDNSNVKFEIKDIQPTSKLDESVLTINDLSISTSDDKTATLEFLCDLEGYYGTYELTVETCDYGEAPMSQNNTITLNVLRFNFFAPVFVFPTDYETIILSEDQITTSVNALKLYNQEYLQDLEVNDSQNHKWVVTFKIDKQEFSEGEADLFTLTDFQTYKARLGLLRLPVDEELSTLYTITIVASVKNVQLENEAAISVSTHLYVRFFSDSEEPEYETNTCEVSFYEYTSDLSKPTETATFPSAVDVSVYYNLLDQADVFKVNLTTGDLSPQNELHYSDASSYDVQIAASRTKYVPSDPSDKSILTVHVEVKGRNMNTPVFHPSKFNGAFLNSFTKDSVIVKVVATDADKHEQHLIFSLDDIDCEESVQAPSIPFRIGTTDGKITPYFILTSSMSGYCTMKVFVKDTEVLGIQHTSSTSVQINIISTDELVKFTFLNDDSYITEYQESITADIDEIFEKYDYKSYLADMNYDKDWANTTVNFYFLDASTEMPVPASEILGTFTDYDTFYALKKSLANIGVILGNFDTSTTSDVEDYLKIWLAATSIVLALFLVLISVAFFFRNRALTQRIKNLSTTKFGSQESDLNRAGLAAPTTNKNAVEGSNPVFNSENFEDEIEPDAKSVISSDSDLFGVENSSEFDI